MRLLSQTRRGGSPSSGWANQGAALPFWLWTTPSGCRDKVRTESGACPPERFTTRRASEGFLGSPEGGGGKRAQVRGSRRPEGASGSLLERFWECEMPRPASAVSGDLCESISTGETVIRQSPMPWHLQDSRDLPRPPAVGGWYERCLKWENKAMALHVRHRFPLFGIHSDGF